MMFNIPVYPLGKYCVERIIFLKDFTTNNILYLGNSSVLAKDCDVINRQAWPKDYCSNIKSDPIDQTSLQIIIDKFKDQFINS